MTGTSDLHVVEGLALKVDVSPQDAVTSVQKASSTAAYTHLLRTVRLVHFPPILACQSSPSLDSMCTSYVDDWFEHRVPATQNHLPNVIEAMQRDRGWRSKSRCRVRLSQDVFATHDIETAKLVENREHEWLALRADVDDPAVGGCEYGPFYVGFGGVDLVVNGRLEVHGHVRERSDVPDGGGT